MSRYQMAETVEEAVKLASDNEDASFVAGGTDVFVNKQQGNISAGMLIDISRIDALKKMEISEDALSIGALVTLSEIAGSEMIRKYIPALSEAALSVASPVIRKTATIGGNILCENRCKFYNQSEWWRKSAGYCLKCNGDICIATGGKNHCFSKFVSDTAPVLIACKSKIVISGKEGEKIIPLESLYTGDGINPVEKPGNSLLKSILIPVGVPLRVEFQKLRPRKSLDFTSLTSVVSADGNKNIRIVLGGVDPMPVIVDGIAGDDPELLIKTALKKSRVVDNDYYSREYRREMIQVFLRGSFLKLGI